MRTNPFIVRKEISNKKRLSYKYFVVDTFDKAVGLVNKECNKAVNKLTKKNIEYDDLFYDDERIIKHNSGTHILKLTILAKAKYVKII